MTEHRADEVEREITKLKLLRFLEHEVGKIFEGVITGVQEFGFFVQLNKYLVEGLVHIRTLADDIYQVDKKNMALVGTRRRKMYKIGEVVRVKIYKIDFLKREIDFSSVAIKRKKGNKEKRESPQKMTYNLASKGNDTRLISCHMVRHNLSTREKMAAPHLRRVPVCNLNRIV